MASSPRCDSAWRAAAAVALAVLPARGALTAQLPAIAAPYHLLRIEFGGAFNPASDVWYRGRRTPVGSLLSGPLDAAATPLVGDLERDLAPLLGHAVSGNTLGALTTVAQWQNNTGVIALAWGATPKLSFFANLPITSIRTERSTTFSAAATTLGLNPAHAAFGNASGQGQTSAFFEGFNGALALLDEQIAAGAYSGATLELANQTSATGAQYASALSSLLAGTGYAVLPLASSVEGMELLARIDAFRTTLVTSLGVAAFSGTPALPTTPLTEAEFGTLLSAQQGFDIRPGNGQPVTSLGRVELGATLELLRQERAGGGGLTAWGRGALRLGTGLPASDFSLLALGTGGKQHQLEVGGTVDLTGKRTGIRGDLATTMSLAASDIRRLGDAGQFLVPAYRRTLVSRREGVGITITAQPWYTLFPHMSVTGLVRYARRSDDHVSFDESSPVLAGVTAAGIAEGTGMSALQAGIGLSYRHDGVNHSGIRRMPVEAGFSVERTLASSTGLVPASLTSKLYLRIYKPLGKR